jgi:cell division transport system permease protein
MADARTRRVLDEASGPRAMTAVMSIMMFLTVLAAAAGLGTLGAARLLDRQLAGRVTVQVIEGEPTRAEGAAARVLAALRAAPEVARAEPVPRAELERLLAPWLGGTAAEAGLPMPAMIDVDLQSDDDGAVARLTERVQAASSAARVDRHAAWMSPVGALMRTIMLIALAVVTLMAVATAATVMLAARAGLETHRATIEVMHMLGSTDVQVARLFQRRIALDAAIGGVAGGALALGVAWLVARQLASLGSELVGGATLGAGDWMLLAALPLAFIALATLAARWTITQALRRTL